MKLVLLASVYDDVLRVAKAAAPLEACGLLAGSDGCATKFYPMTNADASPEHFSLLPAEQFVAVKDMRKHGLDMLGIWHSHPSSPARMSEEDLRLAYTPDVIYVILSLSAPQDQSLCGYKVTNGVPERVEIAVTND